MALGLRGRRPERPSEGNIHVIWHKMATTGSGEMYITDNERASYSSHDMIVYHPISCLEVNSRDTRRYSCHLH